MFTRNLTYSNKEQTMLELVLMDNKLKHTFSNLLTILTYYYIIVYFTFACILKLGIY